MSAEQQTYVLKGGAKLASSRTRTRRGTSVEIFFYELL